VTTKRLIIGAGFVLAVIAVITARAHVGAPAAAAGATSSVPPVIPTSAPRGPTAPAATYPNGTIVPAGGYYTTTNGTPISSLANGPFTAPSGIPAITPTLSNAGPLTPTFTAQDAINYITRHDVGAKVHAMGSVTVAKVSFLPNRDTGTLLGEKLALGDDNRLVCIVQVSGTFSVGGMPGVSSVTMNTAYVAFDAHTGNQLAVIA
jgi:hypothetical protein